MITVVVFFSQNAASLFSVIKVALIEYCQSENHTWLSANGAPV